MERLLRTRGPDGMLFFTEEPSLELQVIFFGYDLDYSWTIGLGRGGGHSLRSPLSTSALEIPT